MTQSFIYGPNNHSLHWDWKQARSGLRVGLCAMLLAILPSMVNVAGAQTAKPADTSSVEITAAVSKSVVQVAEPFQLELNVTAPINTKIFFPEVGDQLGEFEIIDHQDFFDIPLTDSTERRSWTRRLTLESFDTGDVEIPSLEIQISANSSATSIKSAAIPVRVVSVLEDGADPTQFRDIQSVVDVEVPGSKSNGWIWRLTGGLAGVSFILVLVLFIMRRKKYVTPAQWALGELDQLSSSDALKNSDGETVLRELSEILRQYLQLQFEIPATVQTTQELFRIVKVGQFVNLETATQFANQLMAADLVKFAGVQQTQSKLRNAVEIARGLVQKAADESALTTEAIQMAATSQTNYSEAR